MAPRDDRALMLLAEAVSDALEAPIEELPPLSESINLDGLAAVVRQGDAADVTVIFSYAGLRVFVHSGGVVYARPTDGDGTAIAEELPSRRWVSLLDQRAIDRWTGDPSR